MEQLDKDIDNHLKSEEYKNNEAAEWELRCLRLKTPEQTYKALTEVISKEDAIDIMVNSKETVNKIMAEINANPTYRDINGFVTEEFLRHWINRYDFDLTGLVNFLDKQCEKLQELKKDIQSEDLTHLNNSDYEEAIEGNIELHKKLRDSLIEKPSTPFMEVSKLTPTGEVPIIKITKDTTDEEIIKANYNS